MSSKDIDQELLDALNGPETEVDLTGALIDDSEETSNQDLRGKTVHIGQHRGSSTSDSSSSGSSSSDSSSSDSSSMITDLLKDGKISQMLKKPEKIREFFSDLDTSGSGISDLVKEASADPKMRQVLTNLSQSDQGKKILEKMRQTGVNPTKVRADLKKQEKEANRMKRLETPKDERLRYQALLITRSRKVKPISLPINAGLVDIKPLFPSSASVIELACSRLAIGPLAGKMVKIFYDQADQTVNKRTKRLVGYKIGGDLLVVVSGHQMTEKELERIEDLLN